ncbi:hypothetical protein [Streptomyces sp. BE147]|uniref:hypothetical protein n=1 Tax=unclassified Streptomyces TaxID=2593676 RepID=UPI002E7A571D|nr:hypothetical protein [Streptomyces sp. BE147]MEE1738955.1 hypothetical protein [Streptomyces sp. BE147]
MTVSLLSPLSRTPRGTVRGAVAVTALTLVSLALSTGSASAAPAAGSPERLPGHAVHTICTQLDELLGRLPVSSGPVQVCKLVNGWD